MAIISIAYNFYLLFGFDNVDYRQNKQTNKKIKENVMETFRLIIAICMVAMLFCIPLIALKAVLDADKDE